jgi:hypothetical protein
VSSSADYGDVPRYVEVAAGTSNEDYCVKELTGSLNISAMLENANDVEDFFWDPESCSVDTENTDIDDVGEDVPQSTTFSENILSQETATAVGCFMDSIDIHVENNSVDSHRDGGGCTSDLEVTNLVLSAIVTPSENKMNDVVSMAANMKIEDQLDQNSHHHKKQHQDPKTSSIVSMTNDDTDKVANLEVKSASDTDVVALPSQVNRNGSTASAQVNRNRSYTKAIDFCDVDPGVSEHRSAVSASQHSAGMNQPDTAGEQQLKQTEESSTVVPRHKSYLTAVELAENASADHKSFNASCSTTATNVEQQEQQGGASENIPGTG